MFSSMKQRPLAGHRDPPSRSMKTMLVVHAGTDDNTVAIATICTPAASDSSDASCVNSNLAHLSLVYRHLRSLEL